MVGVHLDRRLLPRVDPSDVVQDALAEACKQLPDYVRDRPVAFYPWLRRFAWECLVSLREKHVLAGRRTVAREAFSVTSLSEHSAEQLVDRLATSSQSPERRLMEAELKAQIRDALAKLSEQDREILVLRNLEMLSSGEIASMLGISEAAVRTRLTRALDRLSRKIDAPRRKGEL
jgi:RNA polymerase sigma-70 factor (ECF subfamily)